MRFDIPNRLQISHASYAETQGIMKETPTQKYARYLTDSDYWPRERREAAQLKSLTRIVKHAYEQTEANRDRLAPLFWKSEEPDFDRWDEIPVMTRADLQANPDAYTAREVPARAGKTTVGQTSGSSGRPLFPPFSSIGVVADAAFEKRAMDLYGIDGSKRLLQIKFQWKAMDSEDPTSRSNGWRNDGSQGEWLTINRRHANTYQQAQFVVDNPASYITSSPNGILGVLEALDKMGAQIPRCGAVLLTGEVLTDRVRERILRDLTDTIVDLYGSVECGRMAISCAECGRMYLAEENFKFEFDRPSSINIASEDAYRIIITNYYNFAMPLIRYEVGDWVTLSPEIIPCSRSGRHFERVLGRSRSLWKFPDGTSNVATVNHVALDEIVPKAQWQFIQTALDEATVNIVCEDEINVEKSEAMEKLFQGSIHPQMRFHIKRVPEIPREPSGKFSEFISKIS